MTTDKILKALQNVLDPGERPLITFKTAWKPKFSTPTLWLSATHNRLLLFSTLGGGTVFIEAKFTQINAVITEQGGRLIKVLFWDPKNEDLSFTVDDSVSPDQVKKQI